MGLLYRFGSRLFEATFRAWGVDLQSVGHEHIPAHGPAVLASNHISYLDFAFVMLAAPRPRREMSFMARKEFFEPRLNNFLLRRLGQIPVDVHGDPMAAADEAHAVLSAGGIVGLHPEGTISPSFVVRRGKSGAIRMAERAGAPVIPTAIWGSQRLLTKWRKPRPPRGVTVIVRYGEPFVPTGRTAFARTGELMERIAALLAETQRDYPDEPAPGDDWWVPRHLGGSAPSPEEADARIAAQNEARRQARRTGGARRAPD